MEQDFYRDRLQTRHGLQVLTPDEVGRSEVHRIIYEELCLGIVSTASRSVYQRVMADLVAQGAEAIILGCTEISLLVGDGDSELPLFDTTALHARSAAVWALSPPQAAPHLSRPVFPSCPAGSVRSYARPAL